MRDENTPLVSIYVATYNHESYIRDCLDGILNQITDFEYEILVIDDASTDNNPDIINEYAQRHPEKIRPFLLKENYFRQGRSKIFEIFFPNAKGKYIAFCEGDDYWTYEHKLQRQIEYLESHPDATICFHNHTVRNECSVNKFIPKIRKLHSDREVKAEEIIIEQMMQTATVVARIDRIINDHELYHDITNNRFNFTDIRFYLSYINSGKIYGFEGDWSVYRINDNGVTSIDIIERTINHHQLLDKLTECYDGKYEFLKKSISTHKHLDYWTINRWKKNYFKAIFHLLLAFINQPIYLIHLFHNRYLCKS